MKIHIGPYKKWWGPYQLADLLQHVGVSEDRCHDIGKWLAEDKNGNDSWVLKACQAWAKIRGDREVEIDIDGYDTWNMNSTLAMIILPMLKQLRETKHGSPGSMPAFSQVGCEMSQYSFDFYCDEDDKAWEAGHAQWLEILDEMIWAFEQLQPECDWEDQYWIVHPEMDLTDHPEDEGQDTIPVRWKVHGECDWEGREKHEARIQRGVELFSTYFQNLWD